MLILAVEQAAEVNKLLVGDVFVVDAHALPLTTEEVGGVDSTSTAAIHCIKTLPAATHIKFTIYYNILCVTAYNLL